MNLIYLLILAAPPPQAPIPPQRPVPTAPKVLPCDCQSSGECTCGDDCPCGVQGYEWAHKRAVAEKKPIVVWVNVKPRPQEVPEAVHCFVKDFPEVVGPGIVIGVLKEGSLTREKDLDGRAPSSEIRKYLQTTEQQTFFQRPAARIFRGGGGRSC